MLAALEAMKGTSGSTTVETGVVISVEKGKKWWIASPKVINKEMFVRLCASDRGFLSYVGYNQKNAKPIESNPFLQQLRCQRNDAVVDAMKAKQQSTADCDNRVVLKKDFIDEIEPIVDVKCVGFVDTHGEVVGQTVRMLSTGLGQESVSVKIDPHVMEFIRRGVAATKETSAKRRRCKVETAFQQFPSAFLHKRGFVYCRCRNIDGKWTQTSFPVPKGLDATITRDMQHDAAEKAQGHYNQHHVEPEEDGLGDEAGPDECDSDEVVDELEDVAEVDDVVANVG